MTEGPKPRRRNPESRRAILAATVELLEEVGYRGLTIEGVAQRAGVGKQTIYRWWQGSKPALVLEAFTRASDERVEPPDTGSVRGDLLAILEPVFALQDDLRHGTALANKTLMAEAQLDPGFHPRYVELHAHWWGPLLAAVERGVARGELRPDADAALVVDALLGAAWYRLLLEHAPLDVAAARRLVDMVLYGLAAT
ncbi:MAG: TetR/AcrR family transcriptional regulator [Acidimicrobiales bacterium]